VDWQFETTQEVMPRMAVEFDTKNAPPAESGNDEPVVWRSRNVQRRNVADPGNKPIDFACGIIQGDRKMRTRLSGMRWGFASPGDRDLEKTLPISFLHLRVLPYSSQQVQNHGFSPFAIYFKPSEPRISLTW
jgi:hypothetical protein